MRIFINRTGGRFCTAKNNAPTHKAITRLNAKSFHVMSAGRESFWMRAITSIVMLRGIGASG